MLSIVEIDADNRLAGAVIFDSDDIDAAFEELDARYLAGEAADHAHTGRSSRGPPPRSTGTNFRRRTGSPSTTGRSQRSTPSDLPAAIRAIWDLTPDISTHIEAVHRLSSFGAVVTDTTLGPRQKASPPSGEWSTF